MSSSSGVWSSIEKDGTKQIRFEEESAKFSPCPKINCIVVLHDCLKSIVATKPSTKTYIESTFNYQITKQKQTQ